MKLWIDDLRPAPKGYCWAKSVHSAKIYCCQHIDPHNILRIEEFHLDHDAGNYRYNGGDYIELLKWLEKKQYLSDWKIKSIFKFHSMNPVGVTNMKAICKANDWKVIG